MASQGVNVLRWSALGVGLVYGFWHQNALTKMENEKAAQREWKKQEHLIAQAKAEFAKQHPQKQEGSKGEALSALIGINESK